MKIEKKTHLLFLLFYLLLDFTVLSFVQPPQNCLKFVVDHRWLLKVAPTPFFPRGKEDSKSEGKQFWLGKLYFYRWKTFLSFLLLRVLAVIVGYWKMERAVLCCGDVFNVCGCVCTCKFFLRKFGEAVLVLGNGSQKVLA